MKFIRFAIIALISLVARSCSGNSEEPVPAPGGNDTGYLRLSLSVANLSQSRVGPAAGEDGDGREDGVNKENDIDNIAVFIYDDSGAGLDSDADTPLIAKAYTTRSSMTEENGSLVCTIPMGHYRAANSHRAVVVANAGDITDEVSTLGELRTRPATNAWTPAPAIAATSGFLMASAFNGAARPDDDGHVRMLHDGEGSAKSPNFATSVSIERAAARIDIMYGNPDMAATPGLFYRVKSAQGSTLFLTHAMPVNLMQMPSYTLKHVTMSTTNLGLLVCGDETTDANGNAANYTVEPATFAKGSDTDAATLSQWYGNTAAAYIRSNPATVVNEGIALASVPDITMQKPVDGCTKYRIIAYANENTMLPEAHDSRFISGLALRAIYRPAKIYRDAALTDSFQGLAEGSTFWLLRPTAQTMGDDYCLYFASEAAALEYQKSHPGLIATIEHFPGGVCYYNLWIRHAGDLCAIVRNNIYRIALSFTGPGHPTPELTEPLNIESRIFVRRWNFRPQPEILM